MARILVIDDNTEMLEMLRMILHYQGDHDVILSSEAEQGLETAQSYKPDVTIVDVMMPQMSGYELVRRLRANPVTADIGIIILTARGQPVDRKAALEAGANYYMSKPVDAKELLSEIESLVSVADGKRKSAVFPVLSLRGGIGRTTIAVNLALLLQQVSPTVLLDLSPNSGHCALFLGLKLTRHWGALLEEADLSDAPTIGGLTLKHASGLRLLAAPRKPMIDGGFDPEQIEMLINILRRYMRFIVIDMPPTLNLTSRRILEEARRIIMISGNDSPGIQTTLQTLKRLEAYRGKMQLLINNPAPGRQLPMEALQRALSVPISAQVPYDAKQHQAINSAVPSVLSQPQSPLVNQLKKVTRQLLKQFS